MSGFAIPPMTGATAPPEGRNPQKVRDAAQQFESLLIGPSGNLRAPTLRRGRTLLVGFDEATYAKVLG